MHEAIRLLEKQYVSIQNHLTITTVIFAMALREAGQYDEAFLYLKKAVRARAK